MSCKLAPHTRSLLQRHQHFQEKCLSQIDFIFCKMAVWDLCSMCLTWWLGKTRWRFCFRCKNGTAIRICSENQSTCKRQTALLGSMCKTSRYGSRRLSLHGARLGRGARYVHGCDVVRGFALAAIFLNPFDFALLVHLLVAEFCKMSAWVHIRMSRFIFV